MPLSLVAVLGVPIRQLPMLQIPFRLGRGVGIRKGRCRERLEGMNESANGGYTFACLFGAASEETVWRTHL